MCRMLKQTHTFNSDKLIHTHKHALCWFEVVCGSIFNTISKSVAAVKNTNTMPSKSCTDLTTLMPDSFAQWLDSFDYLLCDCDGTGKPYQLCWHSI